MIELITVLDLNGLISDDFGPWGAIIVLAAKPGQYNVPWEKFKWRLCVSYRKLNQVTKPFQYPIPRCNDAVEEIPPWAIAFISIVFDSGYWQIKASKLTKHKLAFFGPNMKKTWDVIPWEPKTQWQYL